MRIRSKVARALVPLFVVALLAASASPAHATIAGGDLFKACSDGGADPNNCIVSLHVGVDAVAADDDSGIDLDVFFTDNAGMLQIQVKNLVHPVGQEQYELEPTISTSDTVTIVVKVAEGGFTPFFMIGAGVISTWEWDGTDDELTIVVKPAASTFAIPGTLDTPTNNFCPQGSFDPGGDCETADVDYASAILLAADNLPTITELNNQGIDPAFHQEIIDQAAAYTGGFVATDAQEFAIPQLDTSTDPPTVFFDLSAAHFMSDGVTQNEGFFNVLLPEDIFVLWGMTFDQSSPPNIGAAADGSAVSLQAPVFFPARSGFDAGWLIKSNTIGYSSPTITLSPALASAVPDEPTEFDLSRGGTGPATTRLPVLLPDSGEVTRQVTLQGTGASLLIPQGTTVTVGGVPFTGTIDPPQRVQGRPAGLRGAVSITASGGTAGADSLSADVSAAALNASARSAQALADDDIVFDPPVTITIVDTSAEAADSRVVRIAPDGSITDMAGTMTGRGVTAQITGLGTYGLATELDLAQITNAPSISVGLPVVLPSDGTIDFPTTINGASGSISFASGTAVTDSVEGGAFAGTLAAPGTATAPTGVGSAVEIATADGTAVTFEPSATLTLTPPDGTAASEAAPVRIDASTSTSCLSGTTTADALATEVLIDNTGSYGLALPLTIDPQVAIRDFPTQAGLHSRWAGQSASATLCAGQVAELAVRLRNTGTETWTAGSANPVVIAARDAAGAALAVAPLYGDRLATHAEETVAPGEVGTFRFRVRAPAAAGTHRISVLPVAEGLQWLEDEGVYLEIVTR
ncbi:MAG: hypothetical protein ACRDGT_09800 [Candidatus Limnocylindria bacterium]